MLMNLAGSAQTLIIAGVGAFSFKFLTEQYNLDFDTSGYLIGKCTIFYSHDPSTFNNSNFYLCLPCRCTKKVHYWFAFLYRWSDISGVFRDVPGRSSG